MRYTFLLSLTGNKARKLEKNKHTLCSRWSLANMHCWGDEWGVEDLVLRSSFMINHVNIDIKQVENGKHPLLLTYFMNLEQLGPTCGSHISFSTYWVLSWLICLSSQQLAYSLEREFYDFLWLGQSTLSSWYILPFLGYHCCTQYLYGKPC